MLEKIAGRGIQGHPFHSKGVEGEIVLCLWTRGVRGKTHNSLTYVYLFPTGRCFMQGERPKK